MKSNSDVQHLEPCDPFIKLTRKFPGIKQYVHNFRLPVMMKRKLVSRKAVEGSVFVFRKKKLPFTPSSDLNLYSQFGHTFELENRNTSRSRFSCDRCRKYKKKCSRDLPECEYCVSSEELCYYRARKRTVRRQKKLTVNQTAATTETSVVGAGGKASEPSRKDNEPANRSSSTIYQLLN